LLSHGQAQASFNTGSELLEKCEAYGNKTNVAKGNTCAGYVEGIDDVHTAFNGWKQIDKNWYISEGMVTSQLVRVVAKYLQEHPQNLHLEAGGTVANAFIEAFPCEVRRKFIRRSHEHFQYRGSNSKSC
jgi:hypothetical protein